MKCMICPITGIEVKVPEELVAKFIEGGYKEPEPKKAAPRKKPAGAAKEAKN